MDLIQKELLEEIADVYKRQVTGLVSSYIGQGFGVEKGTAAPFLEPVLTYQMILPDGADTTKVLRELKQLEEEEPLLNIVWNPALEEIHVQLMGEVQTEILKTMIAERFHLDVEFGTGKIVYKETIKNPVVGVGHYEPLRHYAEVHLKMEPLEACLLYTSFRRNWNFLPENRKKRPPSPFAHQ